MVFFDQNFNFSNTFKEYTSLKKLSYEHLIYESVDDESFS